MITRAVALGELAEFFGGGTPSKSNPGFYEGDIPWVSPKDMKSWTISDSEDHITEEAVRNSSTRIVPPNSILIVNRSGILKRTLPVGITSRNVAINQDIKALICKSTAYPHYVARMIAAAEPIVLGWVRATTADNFPIENLKSLEIPLPPLAEQKRIAAILDQADAVRHKRQRALDRLGQLGQAIFMEMFGAGDGDISIFEYLDDIQSGKNLVGIDDENGSGFRVLKISAVNRNGFRANETKPLPSDYVPPSSHLVRDGELLFSRANTTELVGIPCIVEGVGQNVALPDKLWRLVPNTKKSVSSFLCYALLSQASRRQIEKMCSGTSGSMQNISMQKFKTIRVPRASMPDQIRFQQAIEVISSARHGLRAHSDRTDALFRSLQHRAFNGDLTASSLKEAAP